MLHKNSEKGQALILIVAAIIGLIGLTGLAVDGGNVYAERRHAQNTADATALAAALASVRGNDLSSAGLTVASNNGFDNDGTTNTVTISNPPTSGPYSGNNEYIQVTITAQVKTYFGPVVGVSQITNTVQATAHAKPSITSPISLGNAIVGLSQDCGAVTYQGSSGITVDGGGLYADGRNCSGNNKGGIQNNSNGGSLTANCLQSMGPISVNMNITHVNGCINTNASAVTFVEPNPVCTGDVSISGNTMQPGNWPPAGYHGDFPPSGVTNLESGIYCLTGGSDFKINSQDTLIGNNVVIVVESGGITINGGANVNLTAPTTGDFKGLLFFMPSTNGSAVKINGNSDTTFTGTFLAPAADITVNGASGSTGQLSSQIIGYTVSLTGNDTTNITYSSADNYNAPTQPDVELVQ